MVLWDHSLRIKSSLVCQLQHHRQAPGRWEGRQEVWWEKEVVVVRKPKGSIFEIPEHKLERVRLKRAKNKIKRKAKNHEA